MPDFILVLGYLDDLLLRPGLIWLAVRMLPASALEQSRKSADAWMEVEGKGPRSFWGSGRYRHRVDRGCEAGYWYWNR